MDLHQLEMFRAVAEEASFTKAAERLHLSQSAVSRGVKQLEEGLGGVLLHRGPKRISLTASGELLLKTAHRINREMQEAVSQIEGTRTLSRGSLSLAGGMTVCMYVLPRVLKRFRKLYPKVELSVSSALSSAILEKIRRREIDIAMLTMPIVADDVEVVPALKEEMVVVAGPGHALTRERPIQPKSLGRYPLILYESGSNTRRVLDEYFVSEGVAVRIAMETENVEIIKAMVKTGLGISIVPYQAIAREVGAGQLFCTRIEGHELFRETGWVYARSNRTPRMIGELLTAFDEVRPRLRLARHS
jgi:DNA-binding transcriptional LysR family regulator